jgi:hypothetical protein
MPLLGGDDRWGPVSDVSDTWIRAGALSGLPRLRCDYLQASASSIHSTTRKRLWSRGTVNRVGWPGSPWRLTYAESLPR